MSTWAAYNHRFLSACIDRIRIRLEVLTEVGDAAPLPLEEFAEWPEDFAADLPRPAIVTLCERAHLSVFARNLLLLCVGMELDSRMSHLCAQLQESEKLNYPTFSLALRTLPEPHWDAIASGSPLRMYRLLNVATSGLATQGRLAVDERVWQHLMGIDHIDHRLRRITEPIYPNGSLIQSHAHLVEQVVSTISFSKGPNIPIIQLIGPSATDQAAIAAGTCERMGLPLYRMVSLHLPELGEALEELTHLMEREFILDGAAFLLDSHVTHTEQRVHERSVARLISQVPGPLFLAQRQRIGTGGKDSIVVDVGVPKPDEQQAQWEETLQAWPAELRPADPNWLSESAVEMVGTFVLDAAKLKSAAIQALGTIKPGDDAPTITRALWRACKAQVRPQIDHLAQRLTEPAVWEDLVLPAPQLKMLSDVEAHVGLRMQVYDGWGFGGKTGRGRGTTVLFAGPSGTGKTLAAEALVTRLDLDLYRVDLGATVSKYIGETEKNLGSIFDAAEAGGIALLFDEADALFGKRSAVNDAKDRYANIEVSFLLQRLESFRGLAILTSNMRDSLDQAFIRRLRFIVEFPFPTPEQRAEIWRRSMPVTAPLEGIDFKKLARLNVAGGTIRNITLNAAFRAAQQGGGTPIRMVHLRDAARLEFQKSQHILTAKVVGDWE
jgi:hypothetical protein